MAKPQILLPDVGAHNRDLAATTNRVVRGGSYRDLSTVCVIPSRGGRSLYPRVVQSWLGMMSPMNQKFVRMFMTDMEVGDAYSQAIDIILANPELSTWQYVLTMEDDNAPPPDGLLKLYESIKPQGPYDAVGGCYFTKGPEGIAQIWGDPNEHPRNFRPQLPRVGEVVPCNGLGQGFTLYRMAMFKDPKIPRPWFKTVQAYDPQRGASAFSQDLHFSNNAAAAGYKFAVDCRVGVGHFDGEVMW